MAVADVIKYEGDNTTFVWKHPIENFNTTTQLIVHEAQEAVFFMNGQALDLFEPGRHTLEAQNIPYIRKLFNLPSGGITPFQCGIYFINKAEQMAIKWGTDNQIQYMDPMHGFPLQIGASGEMALRVEDSRKLLLKVVGTTTIFNHATLTQNFRAFLMTKVKPYLAQIMGSSGISIFDIDSHIGEISEVLHQQLIPDFKSYGLSLERFFVTTIVKPEGEKAYEKYKELYIRKYADVADAQIRQAVGTIDQETKARQTVIEAQSLAQKRQIEGYTYQQERSYTVAENIAKNEGVGNFSNLGIGLGIMSGVAGGMGTAVAGITTNTLDPIMPNSTTGSDVPPLIDAKPETSSSADDKVTFQERVDKLNYMKEKGLLSEEKFNAKLEELLNSI